MMTALLAPALLAPALLLGLSAHAEHLAPGLIDAPEQPRHMLLSSFEFDPTMVWGLGYGQLRTIGKDDHTRPLMISAGLGVPIFLLGAMDNLSLNLNTATLLFPGRWNVGLGLGLRAQTFDNTISHGTQLAWQEQITPGYYGPRWFAGLEVMRRQFALQHIVHDDGYTANFPDAQDGWYAGSISYYYVTGVVGGRIGQRLEVDGRLGLRAAGDLQSHSPYLIPIVVGVGLDYALGSTP